MFTLPFTYFSDAAAVIPARYWVGGTGTWDASTTTNWSLTSGGSGGASVPTAAQNAIFDANSGSGIVTRGGPGVCLSLNFTGFTGTFAGSGNTNISGSLTLGTGMTRTYTGPIVFDSTVTGNTITLAGKTLTSAISFTGVGGEWTLQDTFSNVASKLAITNGKLITNNQACTFGNFTRSSTGSMDCGSSSISSISSTWNNVTGGAGVFNTGTSSITFSGSTFSGGAGQTYYNVTCTGGSGTSMNGAGMTFNNLSVSASTYTTISIPTLTVNGLFTIAGSNANTARVLLNGTGLPSVITAASVALTNVDFSAITGAGAATWSGTSVGDAGGNSGITFTTPVTRYLIAGGSVRDFMGNFWSTSSGGAVGASRPLIQDTPVFDANSFTAGGGLSLASYRLPTLDFTNATNNPTLSTAGAATLYGNLTVKAGMSWTGTGLTIFSGYGGTQTLDTGGVSCPGNMTNNIRGGGNLTLASNLTFALATGTLNINANFNQGAFAINPGLVDGTSINVCTWTKSGDVIIKGLNGNVLNLGSSLTLTDSGGTVKFDSSGASARTASINGKTFNNIENNIIGGGILSLTGNFICTGDLKLNPATTAQFTSATNIRFATFTANGTLGNLASITGASNYNFISTSGTPVVCTFMSIDHCQASGATFAATSSTDGGSNSGWVITP